MAANLTQETHNATPNISSNVVNVIWRTEDDHDIDAVANALRKTTLGEGIYRPDILETIETSIEGLSEELRGLSLDVHGELHGLHLL